MSSDYIQISKINDFIFCPKSIYLHEIYENFSEKVYHSAYQTRGKIVHKNIDSRIYSTSKRYLQGLEIYSEKYGLVGKIDIYDTKSKSLIERKYKITRIYLGYKYQLYAQYFCLTEMGYIVKNLYLHSLSDNKRFDVPLPENNDIQKFERLLYKIRHFRLTTDFKQNPRKCAMCIYRDLC